MRQKKKNSPKKTPQKARKLPSSGEMASTAALARRIAKKVIWSAAWLCLKLLPFNSSASTIRKLRAVACTQRRCQYLYFGTRKLILSC